MSHYFYDHYYYSGKPKRSKPSEARSAHEVKQRTASIVKQNAQSNASPTPASTANYGDDDDDGNGVDDAAYCFVDMLRLLEAVVGGKVALKAEARCWL